MPRFYTIQEGDVGNPTIRAFGKTWLVGDFLGKVFSDDVGKRVFEVEDNCGCGGMTGSILQVESTRQRNKRLN